MEVMVKEKIVFSLNKKIRLGRKFQRFDVLEAWIITHALANNARYTKENLLVGKVHSNSIYIQGKLRLELKVFADCPLH